MSKTSAPPDADHGHMTVPHDRPPGKNGARATEESSLLVDGGHIFVCLEGPGDAPRLLLIHGSGSSTRTWDPVASLLTASHRVIRIDLLGHGRSDKPDGVDYGIPAQALRLAAALDHLGVGPAIVVGHSSGGYVATALAERRPDVVMALVLINTGPRMEALMAAPEGAIEPSQWPHLTDEHVRQAASTAFSRPGYQPPQQVLEDVRGMTYHTFTTTMQASRHYIEQQALPDRLAPLGKPLLVIYGEDDRRWRSAYAADYHAVPGARVEMLPGLGHSPLLEDPPRTAMFLLAFTATHGTRAASTERTSP